MKVIDYAIQGVRGFGLSTYMKAMKVRYSDMESFIREQQFSLEVDPNKDLILETWDSIEPLTMSEAFQERNQEKRRALFACLGPERIFKNSNPTLLDSTVLKIKNRTWDENGKEVEKEIEDAYELYELSFSELFPEHQIIWEIASPAPRLKVVRCWCTSTGREYWIFVNDPTDGRNPRNMFNPLTQAVENVQPIKTAIQAIAWTFRVGVSKEDIEEIYRQGDCLVVKAKKEAKQLPQEKWWHLDETTYREKLVAQS